MRLLLITPKVDPSDDLFGHVHGWITSLAPLVDRLYVVALWAGRPTLPSNVRFASLGKGDREDKLLWLARLQRIVGRLCLGGQVDAVLAHMAPIFAVAAAPAARLAGRPVFLWYAHGHVSPMLRLAHLLVDGVGTSTPEGFRIPSQKVTITGQGIDTGRFAPSPRGYEGPPRILSVGRFSPIKDYSTVLKGFARLRSAASTMSDVTLTLLGGVHSEADARELAALRSGAQALRIAPDVRFLEGLPHSSIADQYRRATLVASASRTGSLDKVVLEAAATGVPPIVSNDAFRPLFGPHWGDLSFGPGDADGLADRLASWLGCSAGARRELALALRDVVEREHGLDRLARRLVGMVEGGG